MKKIGEEFMEMTKYHNISESDQKKGVAPPLLQTDYDKTKQIIDLPKPEDIKIHGGNLREAIENRVSVRVYAIEPMTLEELAWLLWTTQGIKEIHDKKIYTRRTVPSAGARHAFETYVLINKVEGLKPGVYRYLAIDHKLVEYNLEEGIQGKLAEAAYGQKMVMTGSATFIWVAIPYRMCWRYVERGYRYLHLDVGHVCQNLYLAAESIESGVCAIAAFHDDQMNNLLNLDGKKEFVIYLASIGKK